MKEGGRGTGEVEGGRKWGKGKECCITCNMQPVKWTQSCNSQEIHFTEVLHGTTAEYPAIGRNLSYNRKASGKEGGARRPPVGIEPCGE